MKVTEHGLMLLACIGMFIVSMWSLAFAVSVSWSGIYSNPPTPSCPYCSGQSGYKGSDEQAKSRDAQVLSSPAVGIGVFDPNETRSQAYAAEHNEYHRLKAASNNRWIEPNWWQAYVAIAALLIAVTQAVLFWVQLSKMDESLRNAQKTSSAELRAYVSTSIKNISAFNTQIQPGFTFECVNHGQTPARDLEYRGIIGLLKTENVICNVPEINVAWNPKAMNLFPRTGAANRDRDPQINETRIFSRTEIDHIKDGSYFLFIGLEIQYWDTVTGTDHITRNYYRVWADSVGLLNLTRENGQLVESNNGYPSEISFSVIAGFSHIT